MGYYLKSFGRQQEEGSVVRKKAQAILQSFNCVLQLKKGDQFYLWLDLQQFDVLSHPDAESVIEDWLSGMGPEIAEEDDEKTCMTPPHPPAEADVTPDEECPWHSTHWTSVCED